MSPKNFAAADAAKIAGGLRPPEPPRPTERRKLNIGARGGPAPAQWGTPRVKFGRLVVPTPPCEIWTTSGPKYGARKY